MPRKREEKLQEKIRILKERHNKWLHKKKVESASIEPESQVDSTGSYLSHDPYGSHMESFHFTPLPSSNSNDDFLSKLSNKIALQIKDELNINIQIAESSSSSSSSSSAETLASHMEDYLSSELQTHNCQICFELMISPTKTPTLLFPCGHTFCKLCITQYADSHKGSGVQMKCPYCRKDIVNMAENHSLKELIEKFVGQQQHLKSFNSNSNNNSNNNNNNNNNSSAESLRFRCNSADAKMKQKFITEYKNVEVRHRILSNELDEIEKKGEQPKCYMNIYSDRLHFYKYLPNENETNQLD